MTDTVQTPDSGALSIDQAIERLAAPPVEQEEAAPVEAAAEQTEAETSAAEEPIAEAENPAGEDVEGADTQEAETLLEPPLYWKPEAKEAFSKLPPELQAVVLEQEGPREEAASKAKQEAAESKRGADQYAAQVQQIVQGLNDLVPRAQETFKSRWEGIDWQATIREHGPEQTMLWKAQMEAEQADLNAIQAERQKAEALAHQTYLQGELAKLQGTELEGQDARNEVAKYLLSEGYGEGDIRNVSAADLKVARKAMLWDRAQAALKAKPAPKPAAPVKQAVRPAAAAPSSQSSTATVAKNRFAQTRSVDDAVALLLAKAQAQ